MKAIIFIETNKSGSSREAIRAAERLGYYTILFTDNQKQIEQRSEYPDVHLMKFCDVNNLEEMKEIIQKLQLRGIKIKAITSFVDSKCCIANRLAKEFGLNSFTNEAICKMENKLHSRNAIIYTEYCPKYLSLEPDKIYSENDVKDFMPGIIKSPKSAGSKDVYLVQGYSSFIKRYQELRKKLPNTPILLEEYIEGSQYIAEVLVINEKVYLIGIIEQEISYLNDHFIVTGYYLQTEKPEYYNILYKAVKDIIQLHGLKFGPCHLELRQVNGIWKLIEINPRISGSGMNNLIELGTGINLVEQTLKLLLDEEIDIEPKFNKPVYAEYITSSEEGIIEKVTGKNRTLNSKDVLSVYIKPRKGNKITLPLSMGNRYAYVIATGENKDEAKQNAKEAIKEIKFHITNI
jgi:biotin carboxylase